MDFENGLQLWCWGMLCRIYEEWLSRVACFIWQLLEYYSFVTPILDSEEIKWGKEKTKPAANKACPASSKECNKFVAYILEACFYKICPLNKNLCIWHSSSVLGSQPHDGGQLWGKVLTTALKRLLHVPSKLVYIHSRRNLEWAVLLYSQIHHYVKQLSSTFNRQFS